jgi:hypothetical protein
VTEVAGGVAMAAIITSPVVTPVGLLMVRVVAPVPVFVADDGAVRGLPEGP